MNLMGRLRILLKLLLLVLLWYANRSSIRSRLWGIKELWFCSYNHRSAHLRKRLGMILSWE
jgi:hypothetical protein